MEGNVTGRYGDGINAHNGYGATYDEESEDFKSLTITTGAGSNVTGDDYGIFAENQGFGTFTISADGDVTGRYASGIFGIQNGEGMMTIMTGADSDVLGGKDGIDALNFGNGALFVSVAGRVTGQGAYNYEDSDGDGIRAANFGGTLTIVTAAGSTVTGLGDDGIDADHYGYGDLTITVNGTATGQGEDGSGIEAYNRGYINTYQFDQDPSVAETIITSDPAAWRRAILPAFVRIF